MSCRYKVTIKFDGYDFFGWQSQNQTMQTIQGKFNKALSIIFKKDLKTLASGRTDAGVHSLDHHVTFEAPFKIAEEKLVKALNSHLPMSIRAYSCKLVSTKFRPTYDALSKEYRYFFSNLEIQSPFTRNYMGNISYRLDRELMERACKLFEGEHDFQAFHCVGSDPKTTIRKIFDCELLKSEGCMNGIVPEHYIIRIKGNGFLKQMVRLIVGAIWRVGRGKLSLRELKLAIEKPGERHIAAVAPPQGLFKFSVDYPPLKL